MILKSICNTDFYELQMRESSYIYFDLFITFCYLKQVSRIYILKKKISIRGNNSTIVVIDDVVLVSFTCLYENRISFCLNILMGGGGGLPKKKQSGS